MVFFGYGFTVALSGDTWQGIREAMHQDKFKTDGGERFHVLQDYLSATFNGVTLYRLPEHTGDLAVVALSDTVRSGSFVTTALSKDLPSSDRDLLLKVMMKVGLDGFEYPRWLSWS